MTIPEIYTVYVESRESASLEALLEDLLLAAVQAESAEDRPHTGS